ncbi:MAG: EamA family transporter [Paludibacter sp.]
MNDFKVVNKTSIYFYLLLINLFYSFISIATKLISDFNINSWNFIFGIALVLFLFFVYAVLWQQLLKIVPLSTAYMFKGSSVVFIMVVSYIVFREDITVFNIIGCIFVCVGITILFVKK